MKAIAVASGSWRRAEHLLLVSIAVLLAIATLRDFDRRVDTGRRLAADRTTYLQWERRDGVRHLPGRKAISVRFGHRFDIACARSAGTGRRGVLRCVELRPRATRGLPVIIREYRVDHGRHHGPRVARALRRPPPA
jgi:hypothetical protein